MIIKKMYSLTLLKFIGMGMMLLFTVSITKLAGNSNAGAFFEFVAQVTLIATMIGASLQNLAVKYYSSINKREDLFNRLFITMLLFLICSLALTFSFLYAFDFTFFKRLNVIALSVTFLSLYLFLLGILRGIGFIFTPQLCEAFLRPLLLCLGVVIYFYSDYKKLDLIYLCVLFFLTLVLWIVLIKKSKDIFSLNIVKPDFIKKFFYDYLSLAKLSFVSALQKNLDIVLVSYLLSSKDVAFFKVAVVFSSLLTIGVLVSNYLYSNKIAELHQQKKQESLKAIVIAGCKASFYFSLFLILIILITSPFLFYYMFSDDWLRCYQILIILMAGKVVDAYFGSITAFANMTGNSDIVTRSMFVSVILMVFLSFMLVDYVDVFSVAISVSLSCILWNTWSAFVLSKRTGIKFGVFSE